MKIKTEQLKEIVNTAIQGVSNNKLIPITQLMSIVKSGNNIMLTTTDATNYLYVFGETDDAEDDVMVTVYAEQFSKLIGKMSSSDIELNIVENTLHVIGNGDYMLELPLDENGELIKYPDPYVEHDEVDWIGTFKSADVKRVIDSVKPSLATSMEMPAITNYCVADSVVATDRYKIASIGFSLLNDYDGDVLMSSRLMDLISLLSGDINYYIDDTCMIFNTANITVYSKQVDDAEQFPTEAVDKFIHQDFKSVCKINKTELVALLERIALFVGKYDDKAIRLYFEKNGLRVSNKNRKSMELVSYVSSKKHKDYDCMIDVEMLLSQLKAYSGDTVELHYNNDNVIKFVDDDLVQIIALMQD